MGALEVLRRPSRAILDSPRVLAAPRTPYRPSLESPYSRGDAPLLELPMAVAPFTRLPFIGTFATSLPWPLVETTFRAMRGDAFFNFELADEPNLGGWQSGLLWADLTPKPSYQTFKSTIRAVVAGRVDCDRYAKLSAETGVGIGFTTPPKRNGVRAAG